ncbi:MAG: hypothetical protein ACYTFW_04510 [Planctomycetota bacterium]|jgi:hypothetical protein
MESGRKSFGKRYAPILALGLLLILGLAGCTVPNVQPFAEATAVMGRGFREVGISTSGVLRDVPIKDPKTGKRLKPNEKRHPSRTFAATWDDHLRAVEAIETYSATLAEVANANQNSKENAQALVKPLVDLKGSFPQFNVPAAEIGSLLALIKQSTDEVVTYHTLSKQVKAAHPIFQQMVPLMQKALASALVINENSYLTYLTTYETDKNALASRWNDLQTELKGLEDNYLSTTDTAAREELAKRISVVSEMIERLQSDYATFKAEVAAIESRMQNTLSLFAQSQNTLNKWLESHAGLVKALDGNRQPNFTILLTRAEEIKIAIEAINKAK